MLVVAWLAAITSTRIATHRFNGQQRRYHRESEVQQLTD